MKGLAIRNLKDIQTAQKEYEKNMEFLLRTGIPLSTLLRMTVLPISFGRVLFQIVKSQKKKEII